MSKFLITEEEKLNILGMYNINKGENLVNEATSPDPSWLKGGASQAGGKLMPFPAGTTLVTGASAMAKNPGEEKTIIIPKGTKFVLSPSGNFLIGKGYQVNVQDEAIFNPITALNNNQYIADSLKSGKLKATPIDIAIAKGLGGIIYAGGMSPLALNGQANSYLQKQIMSL
jgi:hypothetical protein